MFLPQKSKLDMTKFCFEPGTQFLYCGPGTDGFECRDIPEDGMIDVQGCGNPLLDCITDESPWPCFDEKEECHCAGGCGGSDAPNEATIAKLVTCIEEKIAEKAAA